MTERWIRLNVATFDHPFFEQSPFWYVGAFTWLIAKAAWKPTQHYSGGKMHTVERGSFFCTERQLASSWDVGTTAVRTFLRKLENQSMIQSRKDAGKTLVTLCNYERFQTAESDTQSSNRSRTKAGPKQDQSTKDTSITTVHSVSNETGADAPSDLSDDIGGPERVQPDSKPVSTDLADILWSRGVAYLKRSGVHEPQARSLIGRWLKNADVGAVYDALSASSKAGSPDPVSYISKILGAHKAEQERKARPPRGAMMDQLSKANF